MSVKPPRQRHGNIMNASHDPAIFSHPFEVSIKTIVRDAVQNPSWTVVGECQSKISLESTDVLFFGARAQRLGSSTTAALKGFVAVGYGHRLM